MCLEGVVRQTVSGVGFRSGERQEVTSLAPSGDPQRSGLEGVRGRNRLRTIRKANDDRNLTRSMILRTPFLVS